MQDCIFEVWGVLSAACELCGDPERAVGWFKGHEIADFGGKTPMQLCQEGKAQTVRDYIESLSAGASG